MVILSRTSRWARRRTNVPGDTVPVFEGGRRSRLLVRPFEVAGSYARARRLFHSTSVHSGREVFGGSRARLTRGTYSTSLTPESASGTRRLATTAPARVTPRRPRRCGFDPPTVSWRFAACGRRRVRRWRTGARTVIGDQRSENNDGRQRRQARLARGPREGPPTSRRNEGTSQRSDRVDCLSGTPRTCRAAPRRVSPPTRFSSRVFGDQGGGSLVRDRRKRNARGFLFLYCASFQTTSPPSPGRGGPGRRRRASNVASHVARHAPKG